MGIAVAECPNCGAQYIVAGGHKCKSSASPDGYLRLRQSTVSPLYYDVVDSDEHITVRINISARYAADRDRIEKQIIDAVNQRR